MNRHLPSSARGFDVGTCKSPVPVAPASLLRAAINRIYGAQGDALVELSKIEAAVNRLTVSSLDDSKVEAGVTSAEPHSIEEHLAAVQRSVESLGRRLSVVAVRLNEAV
jgi:hypothetical protein